MRTETREGRNPGAVASWRFDLHALTERAAKRCSPELAVRIAAPLVRRDAA